MMGYDIRRRRLDVSRRSIHGYHGFGGGTHGSTSMLNKEQLSPCGFSGTFGL